MKSQDEITEMETDDLALYLEDLEMHVYELRAEGRGAPMTDELRRWMAHLRCVTSNYERR